MSVTALPLRMANTGCINPYGLLEFSKDNLARILLVQQDPTMQWLCKKIWLRNLDNMEEV